MTTSDEFSIKYSGFIMKIANIIAFKITFCLENVEINIFKNVKFLRLFLFEMQQKNKIDFVNNCWCFVNILIFFVFLHYFKKYLVFLLLILSQRTKTNQIQSANKNL